MTPALLTSTSIRACFAAIAVFGFARFFYVTGPLDSVVEGRGDVPGAQELNGTT